MNTVKTVKDLVQAAKGAAGTVNDEEALAMHQSDAIFLDVREPAEWEEGHIRGARHLPRGVLEMKIGDVVDDNAARIVTYCAAGARAALAAATLKELGYAGAIAAESGYEDLKNAGLPVE